MRKIWELRWFLLYRWSLLALLVLLLAFANMRGVTMREKLVELWEFRWVVLTF